MRSVPSGAHIPHGNRTIALRNQSGCVTRTQLFYQALLDERCMHGADHDRIAANAFFNVSHRS